ncbi:hypothetical protein ASZ78_016981 [Callipepla squamata]|uniref:Uncharacterized protein n=1 Tax=Callipepla squamata TaxID=9009 RepID=A0A226NCX2_CALSU|nr:hypothetical protein ASZ78_016981 [Callipepla squamata]
MLRLLFVATVTRLCRDSFSRKPSLFPDVAFSLLQPPLPVVQAPPAVVPQRPQHYQEPAMTFPVVQPTTVASMQLGQSQPVLASQQVRSCCQGTSPHASPMLYSRRYL